MKFYSLHKQSPVVNFKEATILGQAPDKGLYFPEFVPQLDKQWLHHIENHSNEDIAFRLMYPYVKEDIPEEKLFEIVTASVNFSLPLVRIHEDIFTLELFHGNTLAFKDTGARFMSRCLGYFVRNADKKVTVLVATSGDTGGAVADGFFDVEAVDVVILYPSGKVSSVQEQQLTTFGKNITAIEVNGSFDDCQQLVKQAFADEELKKRLFLTSANSINVARWLPQQFFYAFAWKQWNHKATPPVISVPSGNFGNICAGLLAMKSGIPFNHFIAACNANDVVPKYFQQQTYKAQAPVATLSNAMDVGDPSNFTRILELFKHDFNELKKSVTAYSISDEETKQSIEELFTKYRYTADPHGAVGYASLIRYLAKHPNEKGIFMETAHPVKFYDVVEPILGNRIKLPAAVQAVMQKQKVSTKMNVCFDDLKSYLISKR